MLHAAPHSQRQRHLRSGAVATAAHTPCHTAGVRAAGPAGTHGDNTMQAEQGSKQQEAKQVVVALKV
jgi:hypothetical protein